MYQENRGNYGENRWKKIFSLWYRMCTKLNGNMIGKIKNSLGRYNRRLDLSEDK